MVSLARTNSIDASILNSFVELNAKRWDFWSREDVLEFLVKPQIESFVLYSEPLRSPDDIVAFAIFSKSFEDADLLYIYTPDKHRRLGYADMLLGKSHQMLHQSGTQKILLEVKEGNISAQGLYKRKGYKIIDKRSKYYKDGSAALIMCLEFTE